MFYVSNLVCFCCLLLSDTWSLLISLLQLIPYQRHSEILSMNKTYRSPLQIFRVSLITHGTRCFVISKLGTDLILHGERASSYHLSCFWNLSFPVQTAPIMFLSLFTTEFLLLYDRSGRHLWEWGRRTSINGEDQTHILPLRDYWWYWYPWNNIQHFPLMKA